MYDLISYKDQKIQRLADQIHKLTLQNEKYATWLFELLMNDCPDEYKTVIKKELIKEE